MSYVTAKQVQAWLEETKFPISTVNVDLLDAAKNLIFAELAQRYDTTTWIDADTTPPIVLNIMAMQVAAFEYRAAVAQDGGDSTYANTLEQRAHDITCAIASGALPLPDSFPVDPTTSIGGGPIFQPTDLTTELPRWDDNATPLNFTMTMEF